MLATAAGQAQRALHCARGPRGVVDHEGCDYDVLAARTPDQLTFMEPVIGRS